MSMRPIALTVLGLALAAIAEASALGLLGLSGWFITSCAIAGATLGSTFSYLTPSGGVRAFALTRIAANYAARIVLHRVALVRLTMVRLGLFDAMATSSNRVLRSMRGGEALDRTMRDAAIESESVIRWQAPVATMVFCGCGVAAVILAISPMAVLALATSGFAMLAIAVGRERQARTPDDAQDRARVRGELVAAIDAWPEMRSLGATAALRNRTDALLARQERSVAGTSRSRAATDVMLGVVAAIGLASVVGLAAMDGADLPDLALIALLAAGILESATRLGTVFAARSGAQLARTRLSAVGGRRSEPTPVGVAQRWVRPTQRLRVRGYVLPRTGDGLIGRRVDFDVDAGETMVVFGPTGIGKTTLLSAMADRSRDGASTVAASDVAGRPSKVVFVPHDDHLFTGTVASNLRLADPAATDEEVALLLADFELAPAGISGSTRTGVNGRALSGGEQRRIHLARAVLADPDVLIVDEPISALDERTASVVLDAIRRRLPGAAIVYATHEPLERVSLGTVRTLDLAATAVG